MNGTRLSDGTPLAITAALLLLAICIWGAITMDDTWTRITCIAAVIAMVRVLLETVGRHAVLHERELELRDWLFRTKRFPYSDVEELWYYEGGYLTVFLKNGESSRWSHHTAGIEEFIKNLSERVTKVRSLKIAGDLELDT